jgi:hypothetical protein
MKFPVVLVLALIVGLVSVEPIKAGDNSKGMHFIIRVESTNPNAPSIAFKGAFVAYDSTMPMQMTFLDEKTPFEREVSGPNIIGMFQSAAADVNTQVILTKYSDGRQVGEAKGSGKIHFVHSDRSSIGYGISDESEGRKKLLDELMKPNGGAFK